MHLEVLAAKAYDHKQAEGYAGEVSPVECWEMLQERPDAILVDVRTPPEWTFSGVPDLADIGREPLLLSWKLYPSYETNAQFVPALMSAGLKHDQPIFFLCRTGGRSLDAACAMTAEGYRFCFNVTDGFDGPHNPQQQRGTVAGWRASNLPWKQG